MLKALDSRKNEIFIFFLVSAVNAALLPFFFLEDDMRYLVCMEKGNFNDFIFWLPTRFLWNFTGNAVFRLFTACGYDGIALPCVQFLNVAAGAINSVLALAITRRLTSDGFLSLLVSLFFSFSYLFWAWSMRVKMYPLNIMFTLLSLYCILRIFECAGREKAGFASAKFNPLKWYFLAGIFNGFALFYHMSSVFLVFLTIIFIIPGAIERNKPWPILSYAAGITACLFPFLYVFEAYYKNYIITDSFFKWLTLELRFDSVFMNNIASLRERAVHFYAGMKNAVLAGQDYDPFFSSNIPAMRRPLLANPGKIRCVLLCFNRCFFPAWFLFAAFSTCLNAKKIFPRRGREFTLLLAFFACYSAGFFLLNWYGNLAFMPCLFLIFLTALIIRESSGSPSLPAYARCALVLTLVLLFLNNLVFAVYPQSRYGGNRALEKAVSLAGKISPEDMVIAPGITPDAFYFGYFDRCYALDVTLLYHFHLSYGKPFFEYISARVDERLEKGGAVYVLPGVFQSAYCVDGKTYERLGGEMEEWMLRAYTLSPADEKGVENALMKLQKRAAPPPGGEGL